MYIYIYIYYVIIYILCIYIYIMYLYDTVMDVLDSLGLFGSPNLQKPSGGEILFSDRIS